LQVTDADGLLTWEEAERKRSSTEASRIASGIRPTSQGVRNRYAAPPADTAYPLEYAYHLLGDVRGQQVLDFGCGTGGDSTLIAARGARVTAMDISPDLLELAERRVELDGFGDAITTLVGSAHQIPLPDASVDVVWGHAILHHVDLALASREIHRVLKPGGRAVFSEPLRNSRVIAFLRKLIPYQGADVSPFERPLRHDEIEAFAAPFSSFRSRSFRLPFVPLVGLLARQSEPRAYEVDRTLLRRFPALAYFATIVVFEVRK
jgi:ubiquinone/menaquinone biosynthesis C-methylase UbiE